MPTLDDDGVKVRWSDAAYACLAVELLLPHDIWSLVQGQGDSIGVQVPLACTMLVLEGLAGLARRNGNHKLERSLRQQIDNYLDVVTRVHLAR